jgi:opacity protein-like surface antigen
MLRHVARAAVVVLAVVLLAPAVASAQQTVSFNIGYFAIKGEDGRAGGDVLVANRSFHIFDIEEFSGFTFGGEWLFPVGEWVEVGGGIGYYQKTVPSVYADLVNDNGSEIMQDFKLRVVPISATVRFLPLGQRSAIQPYAGAGLGIFPWRYSETGDFVDADFNIFRGNFVESGTAVGPLVFGGVRFAVGPAFTVGGEVRWQSAEGEFDNPENFNGDRIDLGGITWQATFGIRF